MRVYLGLFTVAFSVLALEVTLVRLLSVTTWYHLAFFAISTAMLGMTAGAVYVYLRPGAFSRDRVEKSVCTACILLALSIPVTLVTLCLVPLAIYSSVMSFFALIVTTAACALPYFFTGIIMSPVLTRYDRPLGRLYASDLLGASLGCLFVLAGLELLDAPSLILLCSATSALGGLFFSWKGSLVRFRRLSLSLLLIFAAAGIANSLSISGIRPVIVKGRRIEPAVTYKQERWNSFSRVAVYPKTHGVPQYWGPSPLSPRDNIEQYHMDIDGEASSNMRRFDSIADIDHLRYDVTNIGHHLGRRGRACVIGAGGGRDVQSALLFGYEHVTGVEINPIFIDLLQGEYKDFTGIAGRSDVTLVEAEARSYLSRTSEKYAIIQMSLIDTWAATGAGAFSLAENSLYTVEAWQVFQNRLEDTGIFSVSRWHDPERIGETGRVLALAVAALLRIGEQDPSKHLALVTMDNISTVLVSRRPFTGLDINRLSEICREYQFEVVAIPGRPPGEPMLRDILSASAYSELLTVTGRSELNYTPPTDESPYFFNMLYLRNIFSAFRFSGGVVRGNLIATLTLAGLLLSLLVLSIVTIVLPLFLGSRSAVPSHTLWRGAIYFSLIGAAFMLTEIALIQRLTILLSHPVYALGILLFTIIASAGIGSLLSDRLPLDRRMWLYIYPLVTVIAVLAVRFLLSIVLQSMVTEDLSLKILVSVAIIFPMGCLMGMFFPVGLRLAKQAAPSDTPWYWALNGVFGVLCSAMAVLISIYVGISTNFYIASACYGLALVPLVGLHRQARG